MQGNISNINNEITIFDHSITNLDNREAGLEAIEIPPDYSDEISNHDNNMTSVLYILAGLQNTHVKETIRELGFRINDNTTNITNLNIEISNVVIE
jgi:polyribonucleotide nucleotidyltransferase